MPKIKAEYATPAGHLRAARRMDAAAEQAREAGNHGQAAFAARIAELCRRQAEAKRS